MLEHLLAAGHCATGGTDWDDLERLMFDRPGWHDYAMCKGSGNLFFSDDGEEVEQARAICRTCPVQPECADAGVREKHGVWGGISATERRQSRRRHRAA
jgi:hypothetical protein